MSLENGLHAASCERVSWQVSTWSIRNTARYTRQHIMKRSLNENATSDSVQSVTNIQHETNGSGTERRRMRIVIVDSSDKEERNIRIEPAPIMDCVGTCDESVTWEQTLPNVIYLNRHDLYEFDVTFADNCSESGTLLALV